MTASEILTFRQVDDLAFAAQRGRLNDVPFAHGVSVSELGPICELAHLSSTSRQLSPRKCSWIRLGSLAALFQQIETGRQYWTCPDTNQIGFLRTRRDLPADDTDFVTIGVAAQKAAVRSGIPKLAAAQIVGALGEMHSNIYEHSGQSDTGLVAFRAHEKCFEWIVADHGVGILSSLKTNPEYRDIKDHGAALRLALSDGCSRHGATTGRGMGFRQIFVGLANLRSELRFRTGDHSLTIDGLKPALPQAKLAQKAFLTGFFISVRCVAG